MRARAIHDIAKLPDEGFFTEIAEGLEQVGKNAITIDSHARFLVEARKGRGARILSVLADEEAAKFLILLDAVRCPRTPLDRVDKQLRKCYSHLAKGIYAQSYTRRPWSFGQLREWIERESQEYYLDGPNGVDWIARNETIQSREDTLYADYIETEGAHFWNQPDLLDESEISLPADRTAIELVRAFTLVGFTKVPALKLIAERWHHIPVVDDFDIRSLHRTIISSLEELDRAGHLIAQSDSTHARIVDHWSYPLYDVDLKEITVNKADLLEERKNWSP